MKKDGSSVGQRVYPVEYSSMTGNTVPHILNSFIPLDGGDDYVLPRIRQSQTRALTRRTLGAERGVRKPRK